MGYKAAPYQISAVEVGAWQLRKRIFIIAHLDEKRKQQFIQQKSGREGASPNIDYGSEESMRPEKP